MSRRIVAAATVASVPSRRRGCAAVAVAGIGFQVVHLVEHVAQVAHWTAHPAEAPWLTPWAAAGRDALAVGGSPATANELLHLVGNVVFLAGLVALRAAVGPAEEAGGRPLRWAIGLQGVHVVEHVLLTGSTVLAGEAVGVTTWFGTLAPPVVFAARVLAHFVLNLVPTTLALLAVWRLQQAHPGLGWRAVRG